MAPLINHCLCVCWGWGERGHNICIIETIILMFYEGVHACPLAPPPLIVNPPQSAIPLYITTESNYATLNPQAVLTYCLWSFYHHNIDH